MSSGRSKKRRIARSRRRRVRKNRPHPTAQAFLEVWEAAQGIYVRALNQRGLYCRGCLYSSEGGGYCGLGMNPARCTWMQSQGTIYVTKGIEES